MGKLHIKKNPTRQYTAAEWEREQYKGVWDDCPYFRSMVEAGEIPADFIGRRTVMVSGPYGCTLLTEGYHFTIEEARK